MRRNRSISLPPTAKRCHFSELFRQCRIQLDVAISKSSPITHQNSPNGLMAYIEYATKLSNAPDEVALWLRTKSLKFTFRLTRMNFSQPINCCQTLQSYPNKQISHNYEIGTDCVSHCESNISPIIRTE